MCFQFLHIIWMYIHIYIYIYIYVYTIVVLNVVFVHSVID